MCGLVGFISQDPVDATLIDSLVKTIIHRGPNSNDSYCIESRNIFIGHTRLSIQDLSDAGHQPMSSFSKRYVMVFNGEIYNHVSLRKKLSKKMTSEWRGHSDTETLLMGFEIWGIRKTLERCVGMFALAVWDSSKEQLILARDRFGEKPLYYGMQNRTFMFASELKALKTHPHFENKINRNALGYFFQLNYIPTPLTIYEGICKLQPATISTFSHTGKLLKSEKYWDLEAITIAAKCNKKNEEALITKLESLVKSSIKNQMISDVPLGAFLSGGIDSSTVVAILQSISNQPVKTFTIGFKDKNFNEASDAKDIAKFLGTDHEEMIISVDEALSIINKLPTIYDEPFADSSQIATYLVSQLAKKDVTVVLTGDGGDEIFCGYNRYLYAQKVWSKIEKLPLLFRKTISKCILIIPTHFWDTMSKIFFLNTKFPGFSNKLQKSALALEAKSIYELYLRLTSNWQSDELIVKEMRAPKRPNLADIERIDSLSDAEKMMLWDKQSYLIDDVLVKVDRATMACSLESRVPLLDHRIVEFAATLPLDLKLRDGRGKWVLRQLLYKYIPKDLVERPKQGFSLPISEWLRGPLKDWADALLDSSRIEAEGYLEPKIVSKKWQEHLAGKRDWSVQIWSVLMFQLWLEKSY